MSEDENLQGLERRIQTSSSDDSGKDHRFFEKNGYRHFPFEAKKVVTVGFLFGLLYFVGTVVSNYKLALSEIDARIDNYKPLNQRLDKIEWKLEAIKEKTDKQEAQFQDIQDWFKNKGKR